MTQAIAQAQGEHELAFDITLNAVARVKVVGSDISSLICKAMIELIKLEAVDIGKCFGQVKITEASLSQTTARLFAMADPSGKVTEFGFSEGAVAPLKYETQVRCDDENAKLPDVARFEIGKVIAKQIIELASLVTDHGLLKVEKQNYQASWFNQDDGPEDAVNVEMGKINVSRTEFWFSGFLKHTKTEIFTERRLIAEISAHFYSKDGLKS